MLHVSGFDLMPDIDAHGAIFGAGLAIDAAFWIGLELERMPPDCIPCFPPENHEGSNPTSVMTKGVSAGRQSKNQEYKQYRKVGNELHRIRDRNPIFGHIEGMNLFDATSTNESEYDEYEPRSPNEILDPMMFGPPLVVNSGAYILKASHRTCPPTKSSPDKQR